MQITRIRRVGNSTGLTFNRAQLGPLAIRAGDTVVMTATGDTVKVQRLLPHQADALRDYQAISVAFHDTLVMLDD